MKEYSSTSNEPNSLVYIQASESYPKKKLISDDPSLPIPFSELTGENVEYLGKSSDTVLVISNFRFFALLQHAFINIPLMLIGSLEWKGKELPELFLWCKDGRSFQLKFDNSEYCAKWFERLKMKCAACQGRLENIFSFAFHAWSLDSLESSVFYANNSTDNTGKLQCDFMDEYKRMGFNKDRAWKITEINSKFELCPSYPKLHIVPSHITDEKLGKVARFRSSRRFPSAVWRHKRNGAVIVRCSQPEVGLLYRRCEEDEYFLQSLGSVIDPIYNNKPLVNGVKTFTNGTDCHENGDGNSSESENSDQPTPDVPSPIHTEKKVLVLDCRSFIVTIGNKLKGGGTECTEYYPNCDVQFMNLANIHAIRTSFQSLRELCCRQEDNTTWLSSLETSQWLFHISLLIKTSLVVVKAVEQHKQHVVVHCSDGWDRTTQVVALSELLLDPFYRTIEGFRVLLEREWLAFGHKFADRSGHGCQTDEPNERCPVFLQWLDCVHQLLRQFPCSFQFNETFLVKLAHHSYSCLFGTFLCNTEQERLDANIKHRTHSVWSLLSSESRKFRNFLYSPLDNKVLYPEYQVRNLLLWKSLYLASPVFVFDDSSTRSHPGLSGQQELPKENPPRPNTVRRNSDGDIQNLILNSEDRLNTGPEFRDDTNSELCSAKALVPKPCSESYKYSTTKGLLLNSMTDTPLDGSECIPNGSTVDVNTSSMTSSSHTLVEENTKTVSEQNGDTVVEKSDCFIDNLGNENGEISNSMEEQQNGDLEQNFNEPNNLSVDRSSTGSRVSKMVATNCNGHICHGESRLPSQDDVSQNNDTESNEPYNVINKHMDVDGLTLVTDPVQSRLLELERSYRRQIDELQTQLQAQGCRCPHEPRSEGENYQKMAVLLCAKFDGPNSLSSNATTDTCGSWEHVEEDDVTPTLWVPDHLAYRCCSCDATFSVTNRKHHCRNCGNVFCHQCCSDMVPVPSEQHYDPVRVCKPCYQKLQVPHEIAVATS